MKSATEYLLTNGLGGYSLNALDHKPTRKYHGLYTISKEPPTLRWHLVSRLVESINLDGEAHPIPKWEDFQYDGVATHLYTLMGMHITRSAAFKRGSNLLAITYVFESPTAFEFTLTPTFNFRDHHDLADPIIDEYSASYDLENANLLVEAYDLKVYVHTSGAFTPACNTHSDDDYSIEMERGYPSIESHISFGNFSYAVPSGATTIEVVFHTQKEFVTASQVFEEARDRMTSMIDMSQQNDPRIQALIRSCDDFIVHRKYPSTTTVIAGYPWFTDWGRDTMIALPGLLLTTKRYEVAFEIIQGFLSSLFSGIIPNTFPDQGELPHYNTADGTLWLFNAFYALYQKSQNKAWIMDTISAFKEILMAHMAGTINNIRMDRDGLLLCGDATTQLTWMDVKIDDWVVTPRYGKVVEINALWYNAICIYLALKAEIGQPDAFDIELMSVKTKIYRHFNASFVHPDLDRLYDYIADGLSVDIPRPNMLLPISLPFPVLTPAYWKPVVTFCQRHFKTPAGLRTLSPDDQDYIGIYEGTLLERDGAYHRGTVWTWLIGPYLDAHYKAFQDLPYIQKELESILSHVNEGLVGSLPEICDGDAPHHERGCPAQAWSVAEVLRIAEMLKEQNKS